jgi:hypothetical protein
MRASATRATNDAASAADGGYRDGIIDDGLVQDALADETPPRVVSARLVDGATLVTSAVVQLEVVVDDDHQGKPGSGVTHLRVREMAITCQAAYADDGWVAYRAGEPVGATVSYLNGDKRLCIWAKDAAGLVSTITAVSPDNDRLLFAEETKLRFVARPYDSARATLGTIGDTGLEIDAFVYDHPAQRLYYISDDERLHCYDLNGIAPPDCDNSAVPMPPELDGLSPYTLTRDDEGAFYAVDVSNRLIYRYQP